jgi:hypothetical protein
MSLDSLASSWIEAQVGVVVVVAVFELCFWHISAPLMTMGMKFGIGTPRML